MVLFYLCAKNHTFSWNLSVIASPPKLGPFLNHPIYFTGVFLAFFITDIVPMTNHMLELAVKFAPNRLLQYRNARIARPMRPPHIELD